MAGIHVATTVEISFDPRSWPRLDAQGLFAERAADDLSTIVV